MPEFIAHTVTGSTSKRVGPGRWAVVMTPCPGILWTNDVDAVGFLALSQVADTIFDSTDIDEQIQTGVDAGRTATQIFDGLSALVGKTVSEGDLATWRKPVTRRTAKAPGITGAEILERAQQDGDDE